jgi:4'-phosphopantetheinyl transferase
MQEVYWQPPPAEFSLDAKRIHVWRIWLDLPDDQLEFLRRTLSPDQLKKAKKFRFQRDQKRFIATHGCTRKILSNYLSLPPVLISYVHNEFGKPELADEINPEKLHFNLSHSEDIALLGISSGKRVGVDIERIVPNRATEEVARRFFSPSEVDQIVSLPEDQQIPAFYRCWTRKEAYIKTRGEGMSIPLDQFEVSCSPEEIPKILHVQGDRDEASRWSIHHIEPLKGYVAALAVEGHPEGLLLYQWIGWPDIND